MSNTTTWSISGTEIGKACGATGGDTFKVYIAKVLPLVSFGKPKVKTVAIKKTCYINATKCKPSISTKVKTRNYLNLKKATGVNINHVSHGTKLKIDVENDNIDRMYVCGRPNKIQK